jgi:hypothetical protein
VYAQSSNSSTTKKEIKKQAVKNDWSAGGIAQW